MTNRLDRWRRRARFVLIRVDVSSYYALENGVWCQQRFGNFNRGFGAHGFGGGSHSGGFHGGGGHGGGGHR